MTYREKVEEAARTIQKAFPQSPEAVLVLGSGLGGVAEAVENQVVLPYGEIPHWPVSTAPGHSGRLVCGLLEGRQVIVMQGRVHYYEGYSMEEVTFPVRVFGVLKAKNLVLTNASGGIDLGLLPGDLVALYDHINLLGRNPLMGPNEDDWGPRFSDAGNVYRKELLALLEESSLETGVPLKRGVYVAFSGPSFETPAEIRMARILGADVVGMSTVPEALVASHMNIPTCAISCVANYAAGITPNPLTHEEVLEEVGKAAASLEKLLRAFLRKLA
ncbi:MAG TPA: purine-nucleoside phosphorylase [Synergistaceae bacterium]|nr:purine-nucleoside phosphorylase [Synergistaceae bacterium]HPQ36949.1 purine-nucleoside phosphorylase [Synergistaceae bacterium]